MNNMMRARAALLVAVATAALSCRQPTAAPTSERMVAADTAGIGQARAEMTRYLLAGDASAVIAGYADSAVYAGTGSATLQGHAALLAFLQQALVGAKVDTFELQPLLVVGHGGIVTEIGNEYEVVTPNGQPPQQVWGRYQLTWQRLGGRWKVLTDVSVDDSTHAAK
jgi:ketosteroid isomerase-like protein